MIYITRVLQIRYNDIMYILYYKVDEFDLPVKRNQAFVVTQFTKSRERFCDHLLGDEEEQQLLRKELLIKVSWFIIYDEELCHFFLNLYIIGWQWKWTSLPTSFSSRPASLLCRRGKPFHWISLSNFIFCWWVTWHHCLWVHCSCT